MTEGVIKIRKNYSTSQIGGVVVKKDDLNQVVFMYILREESLRRTLASDIKKLHEEKKILVKIIRNRKKLIDGVIQEINNLEELISGLNEEIKSRRVFARSCLRIEKIKNLIRLAELKRKRRNLEKIRSKNADKLLYCTMKINRKYFLISKSLNASNSIVREYTRQKKIN